MLGAKILMINNKDPYQCSLSPIKVIVLAMTAASWCAVETCPCWTRKSTRSTVIFISRTRCSQWSGDAHTHQVSAARCFNWHCNGLFNCHYSGAAWWWARHRMSLVVVSVQSATVTMLPWDDASHSSAWPNWSSLNTNKLMYYVTKCCWSARCPSQGIHAAVPNRDVLPPMTGYTHRQVPLRRYLRWCQEMNPTASNVVGVLAVPKTRCPQLSKTWCSCNCPPRQGVRATVPKTRCPQLSLKTGCPQLSPKTRCPQLFPKTRCPQLFPKARCPQLSLKTRCPQVSPKTRCSCSCAQDKISVQPSLKVSLQPSPKTRCPCSCFPRQDVRAIISQDKVSATVSQDKVSVQLFLKARCPQLSPKTKCSGSCSQDKVFAVVPQDKVSATIPQDKVFGQLFPRQGVRSCLLRQGVRTTVLKTRCPQLSPKTRCSNSCSQDKVFEQLFPRQGVRSCPPRQGVRAAVPKTRCPQLFTKTRCPQLSPKTRYPCSRPPSQDVPAAIPQVEMSLRRPPSQDVPTASDKMHPIVKCHCQWAALMSRGYGY